MKPQLALKLQQMHKKYEEIQKTLQDPHALEDYKYYQSLTKACHELKPVVEAYESYRATQSELEELSEYLKGKDPELKQMAQEEYPVLKEKLQIIEDHCLRQLIPHDPLDKKSVILEIRAGAGGLEAALFVGDIQRMYMMLAELRRWKVEIMQAMASDQGGFREVVMHVSGEEVYRWLKYESGTHRVQRVPETENQGRIHTSTITVAVLPEADEVGEIEIDPSDLRIDTFRSSGAGGQHVNTTDSAVRVTHIPSGVVVECQDERSQHKNRARALAWLKSRLMKKKQDEQMDKERALRQSLVGSGDRSERIRTYNFPQSRLTDHRINFSSHDLTGILAGKVLPLLEALQQADEADRMAGLLDEMV